MHFSYLFTTTLVLVFLSNTTRGEPQVFTDETTPYVQELVGFWTKVYGELSSRQGVIHDGVYGSVVYETLVLPERKAEQRALIRKKKEKWRAVLLSVHKKQNTKSELTADEAYVENLFAGNTDPCRFVEAATRRRIRFQLGQSDVFRNALISSGRYLPAMEKIFHEEEVPVEITRLPFVESGFNLRARSKVGASGIWQFIRGTGRDYLRIDHVMDERNDPLQATRAAARLLKANYEQLGSWALAVIAYNHGRKSIMRAVRLSEVEDFASLLQNFKGARFGFASRNFFPSLLAAIAVEGAADRYFGPVVRDKPISFEEVRTDRTRSIRSFRNRYGKAAYRMFVDLNPALQPEVFEDRVRIPKGTVLRVPR